MTAADDAGEPNVVIRPATPDDAGPYLLLVDSFAAYQRLTPPDQDAKARLIEHLFSDRPRYRLLVAEVEGEIVGFASWFFAYSTFLARPTFYLEDIYVTDEHRGASIGHRLLVTCARRALAEGCGRLDLSVLSWNELGLAFYERHGVQVHKEWTLHRFEGDRLENLAGN